MTLPASAPRRHMHARHTREMRFKGCLRDDGLWDIEAHLTDIKSYALTLYDHGIAPARETIHDILLRMTVDERMSITAVVGTMARPLPTTQIRIGTLAGTDRPSHWLRLARNHRTSNRGDRSCTHLRELLFGLGTVAFQTMYLGRDVTRRTVPPIGHQRRPRTWVNAYQGFRRRPGTAHLPRFLYQERQAVRQV